MVFAQSHSRNVFVPPEGKVLMIIGQDLNTIDQYVKDTGAVPSGVMLYTSIQELEGLTTSEDRGGGLQHAQKLATTYPDSVLQIGLYMVGVLQQVADGVYDENIVKLADWIKRAERPVYLRIGYEFDLPDNHYDPALFVAAYRHIVDKFKALGVDNVNYVWHSYSFLRVDHPFMGWYPGDDDVDWFGISFFEAYNFGNMERIAKFAQEHGKPLMIAEASPFYSGTTQGEKSWNMWFRHLFRFIEKNNVKIVSYINCDWDDLSMFAAKKYGDARIQSSLAVYQRWIEEIKKDQYLHSSPNLFKTLGYHPFSRP